MTDTVEAMVFERHKRGIELLVLLQEESDIQIVAAGIRSYMQEALAGEEIGLFQLLDMRYASLETEVRAMIKRAEEGADYRLRLTPPELRADTLMCNVKAHLNAECDITNKAQQKVLNNTEYVINRILEKHAKGFATAKIDTIILGDVSQLEHGFKDAFNAHVARVKELFADITSPSPNN